MTDPSAWLSISEAARHLGVHFTTLRRWSDQGLIEYVRTPGGKRKYQQKALDAFVESYRAPVRETNALLVLENQAITRTREELQTQGIPQKGWYGQLTDTQRTEMRSAGTRLIALMLQYNAHPENRVVYLDEAKRMTRIYGSISRAAGISLTECVQTFLLFRQPILKALHETDTIPGKCHQDNVQLFEQLNHFLDEALIAMIDEYQSFGADPILNHR